MKKEIEEKLRQDPELYKRMKAHLYSRKPILGEQSPFSEMLQGMVNTILDGEMDSFIEDEVMQGKKNKRNGKSSKKVISSAGLIHIDTPRDRNGDFHPELIEKRQRQLSSGLDEQIIALYAQGNSVEDVRRLLRQMFGVEISAGKISQITDKILPVLSQWRSRPLEAFYPIVYLDAIHFKVKQGNKYASTAFYTVYSVNWDGQRDVLGIYILGNEGAHNWGSVLMDLKNRGVEDILVVCTDNLKGFSEVIAEEFPLSIVQKCIVHQVRNSLKYVDEKDRKKVVVDLRKIYTSISEEQALNALRAFEVKWQDKYAYIVKQWEQNWDELMAFLHFPMGMRKMIYTTNPVEALHRIIRRLVKAKAAWSSEQALAKQIYLSLMHNEKSWRRKAYGWVQIRRDIMLEYPNRIPDNV